MGFASEKLSLDATLELTICLKERYRTTGDVLHVPLVFVRG